MKTEEETEKVIDAFGEITLIVDYTKTVEQAINDGNYDWKNSDITSKNFPISPEMIGKKVKIATKLFHFNHDIDSDSVITEMDKEGYRPAVFMEFLALGILHFGLQIIALGSVWRGVAGVHYAPYRYVDDNRRKLSLRCADTSWGAHYHFLGVLK